MEQTKLVDVDTESRDYMLRLKEDALVRAGCGIFVLWRMEREAPSAYHYYASERWIKDEIIGYFDSREPCEEFLDIIRRGPEAKYEYQPFHQTADHISGYWSVEINDEGDGVNKSRWCYWNRPDRDYYLSSFRHGDNRVSGYGRTYDEAVANARRYREELRVFIRDVVPTRPKGCWCQPRTTCGYCDKLFPKKPAQ